MDVPANANTTVFKGKTYGPGDRFTTSNACEALSFADTFKLANPDSGRTEEKAGQWDALYAACPAGEAAVPGDVVNPPTDVTDPAKTGGDGAAKQGAPANKTGQLSGSIQKDPPATSDQTDADPTQTDEPRRPPTGEVKANQAKESAQQPVLVNDPIDLFSGSYQITETDLEIPNTILPMAFVRSYRSGNQSFGPLGWNWDHNFNLYLRELSTGDVAVWRNLRDDVFRDTGVGFEPPRGTFERLQRVPGVAQAWELLGVGGTVMRFQRPAGWTDAERIPLVWIRDRHGNGLRLDYTAHDQLQRVRDDRERALLFDYDECGLLVTVSDHNGRQWTYRHDEQTFELHSVTTPPTTDFPEGSTRLYRYSSPAHPLELRHAILAVTDAGNNVFVENTYEEDPSSYSFGRVTEQLFGGFLHQYRYSLLQWAPLEADFINIASLQVEVMNPDCGVETHTFNFRGDLLDQRFRLVKDRSFRIVATQFEYDEQGNLVSTTRPDGSRELNTFDAGHADPRMRGLRLRREVTAAAGFPAPSRIRWRATYETTYQLLTSERDESGAVTRYDYDLDLTPGAATNTGKLKRVRHPQVTLPDGTASSHETHYEHLANGLVAAVIGSDGVRTELDYGVAGVATDRLVRRVRDPGGLALTASFGYDALGNRAIRTDAAGQTTTTTFNSLGLPERIDLPAVANSSGTRTLHYDVDRRVVASTRPRGDYDDPTLDGADIRDEVERDVLGNPVLVTLGANTATPRRVHTAFDFRGMPIRMLLPDGSRNDRVYDERGLLVSETLVGPDGTRQEARESYDVDGTLRSRTDTSGSVSHYERDGFNRIRQITAPTGTECHVIWGEDDVVLSIVQRGVDDTGTFRDLTRTEFEYDEWHRAVRETTWSFTDDPTTGDELTTSTFLDAADRPTRTIDHRGALTRHTYDTAGRLTTTTDPMGNVTSWILDPVGRQVEVREEHQELGGSTQRFRRFEFDVRGRRTAVIHPDGARRETAYDDRGLIVLETDELGVQTMVDYDAFGVRVAETVDPAGFALQHTWDHDELGRVTQYVDPAGQVTSYELDGLGRRVCTVLPSGASSLRTFDSAGDLVREETGSGVRFDFGYDAGHRLTTVSNSAVPAGVVATPDLQFTYDGLDRLVHAAGGPGGEVRRSFDSLGRLVTETSGGVTVTEAHDDLGGRSWRTWPDGRTEESVTDLDGFVSSIDETVGGTVGAGVAALARFVPSGPVAVGRGTLAGSVTLTDTYDDRMRLIGQEFSGPQSRIVATDFLFDQADHRSVSQVRGNPTISTVVDHDAAARVTLSASGAAVAVPVALSQAQHDAAIAATRVAMAGAPRTSYIYDAADARTKLATTGQPALDYVNLPGHLPASAGVEAFSYSGDVSRTSDAAFSYTVDSLGRTVRIASPAGTVCELAYDALGRPGTVTQNGVANTWVWFGEHPVQEMSVASITRQITLDPATGLPLAWHVPGETWLPLFDAGMNLVAVADAAGALRESYRYQIFGLPRVFDPAGSPLATSALGVDPVFGGQRLLSSTGLYLSTRRLYDPRHGLFLASDPLGYAQSPSLFVYAGQDPVDLVDPDGDFAFLAILAIMAVGALIAGGMNIARQRIQMAENPARRAESFSWGELGLSMGIGAVMAPVLTVAPELAIPLAGLGVAGGAREISNGNYATGSFDIVTAVAPFGSKNVRAGTFGKATLVGEYRGLGPSATWNTRVGRFNVVQANPRATLEPALDGRDVGVGYAAPPGSTRGHAGVIIDDGSGFTLFHKNGQRSEMPGWKLEASFEIENPLPSEYFNGRNLVPFEYESVRVPKSMAEMMSGYAKVRMGGREEFVFGTRSCGNFTSDVLAAGGIKNMQGEGAFGVSKNFSSFVDARNAASLAYGAGFWGSPKFATSNRKCAPASP